VSDSERALTIPVQHLELPALLGLPAPATGIVLFAHGSGSGRFSPRNNYVARILQEAGLATVLIDLLTETEAGDRRLVFDIDLLADRLERVTLWLGEREETRGLPVGYFGASTGGGAALVAAARLPGTVRAVVSRGGRPDLAAVSLPLETAPTLLIVGGNDEPVIALHRQALAQMRCERQLIIVPGATHLFEEPGALERVAELARDWFMRHLAVQRPA